MTIKELIDKLSTFNDNLPVELAVTYDNGHSLANGMSKIYVSCNYGIVTVFASDYR